MQYEKKLQHKRVNGNKYIYKKMNWKLISSHARFDYPLLTDKSRQKEIAKQRSAVNKHDFSEQDIVKNLWCTSSLFCSYFDSEALMGYS